MKAGSADRYFQKGDVNINKLEPEGIVARVPFKGMLSETVFQLVGGIRAGMGYCGARDIEALKQAQFIRITSSGMQESIPTMLPSRARRRITAASTKLLTH